MIMWIIGMSGPVGAFRYIKYQLYWRHYAQGLQKSEYP